MRNIFKRFKLNNSVILLVILLIICVSTAIFLVMLNKNMSSSSSHTYISPPEDVITNQQLTLAGYQTYELQSFTFYQNPTFYYTTAEFPQDAYVEYNITSTNKVLGENVDKNQKIGENNGSDVKSSVVGIVIDIQEGKIILQDLDCLYAEIEVNFLYIDNYKINTSAYVFYDCEQITQAKVDFIDYLSAENNSIKVRLKIENFPAIILTNTNISIMFAKKDESASFAINSRFIDGDDVVYKSNQFYEFLIEENNCLKFCTLKIGRVFYEYAEIEELYINGERRIIDSGMVFYGKY